ncbi:MAG TPA: (2E,6E)-farnesyl diphosphate synthase [Candidatus Competibacteraceae bacterium]|nr:(2E,6E)-farnesyl diphosphate synthase [Candidatus Competibacteraceae bacterium]MCP5132234.1 (2E,6E)-farnesyl diphosphate synthase [Gammaproteobacteria bacterium]HPF59726.1 (2E,6E)-farnesyl diphosphate synthase [Candidatus Competibacteraceae bacterium]HRY17672.1 (2E,6E)-farnesyl diphosphate synthase [Candidatus Competibacteraceae bacterium]
MAAELIKTYQTRAEQVLDQRLPAASLHPSNLHQAMRYAVLGGGKRIRPVLVYLAGHAVSASLDMLDGPACAVEFIHAYSLIHDDLPAMDNDDLRHGQPACHKAFGEALAILAGDALQALAFQVLAQDPAMIPSPAIRLQMQGILAQAAGSRGMAGGQAIDLAATGQELTLAELENMHIHKTGALIRASVLMGALSQPAVESTILERLDRYAKCIGLAFQIQDDILDVMGDTITLGKTSGVDRVLNKPTYPALLGVEGAREHARILYEEALASLESLDGNADPLRRIAAYIVERAY